MERYRDGAQLIVPERFGDLVKREIARHTHPFVFSSNAIRGPLRARQPSFVRRVHIALTRSSLVFTHHAHRRGALVARMEKASLHMYDLGGADLSGFSMKRADLVRAHLAESDLSSAMLFRAKLEAADLTDAKLMRADLRESDLGATSLVRADLRGALLQGANLRYADLRGANVASANFSGADLRDARLDADFDRAEVVSDEHTVWPDGLAG